ncbi:MAG: PAS domain S-box protein [Acidobacteria bacterium]|nr:MAG: PAS domain S-box protein [Acidobacteriota bacterium]
MSERHGKAEYADAYGEIRDLRQRLAEAEETLRAIREGEVDAIVVSGKGGQRVFSLTGSEQVYRLIVETMKEAALTVAFDETILFCNAQFGQFLGLPQEKILGHPLHKFVTPDQTSSIPELLARSGRQPVRQRLVFQREGHRPVPAHISASILNQPDGVSVCIVATDLTELETSTEMLQRLRRQQEALLDSESRLRAVFAVSQDAIVITDDEGRYLEGNPAASKLFGFDDYKALEGKRVFELVSPEDEPGQLWTDLKRHGCYQGELRLSSQDGRNPLIEVFAVANIRPGRHLAVLRDITEKRHAEQALKASHNLLEQKVQERTSELAAAVKGLEAEIARRLEAETDLHQTNQLLQMVRDCNEAIVRIDDEQQLMNELCRIIVEVGNYRFAWVGFAQTDAQRTVRPVSHYGSHADYLESARICWDDSERGRGPTGRAIRAGTVQFGLDFVTEPVLAPWRKLARRHGFRSSIALPLSDGKTVFGALTIYAAEPDAFGETQARILTELADDLAFGFTALRTRKALRESRDLLRQLGAELTLAEQRERQRIAGILHDHIQQLLVAAKFQVAALSGTGRDLEGTKEIQGLLDESIKASRTLTTELSPPILKEGLAASLTWLAGSMAEKYGVYVELDIDDAVSRVLEEVKMFLFEATRELLFNVAKHAQVKSATVSLRKLEDERAEIVVADRGVGFDPNTLKTGRGPGEGFGLFNLRQRIDLIGGQLEITSKPGEGSRFRLTIPTRAGEAIAPKPFI